MSGEGLQDDYGANSWLVEEMYEKYKQNPDSVDKAWWPILENYQSTQGAVTPAPTVKPPQFQT